MGNWKYATINTDHKWVSMDDETLGIYNELDCRATAMLMRKGKGILKDYNNYEFWNNEVKPLIPAAMAMQKRGLPVSIERRNKHLETYRTVRDECDETIAEFAASHGMDDFNPGSPPQRAELLYRRLGLPKKTKQGRITTDQDALLKLWDKFSEESVRPLLEALLHRSRVNTILTRYLNFPLDPDGRVRPTVKMFGAKTLRYAYENPPMQQWVKEIRGIVHDSNKRLIAFDYSALEARILAYQFNDTRDIECFENKWDLHLITTNDLFQLGLADYEGWDKTQWDAKAKENEEARTASKSFRFGKAYGGSATSMRTRSFCPCDRWGCSAKLPPTLNRDMMIRAEFEWNQTHREYEATIASIIDEVRNKRYYTSPFGFTRFFTKPFGTPDHPGEAERELRNFFGQHPAAAIINRAQRKAEAAGLPIIFQMHDALMLLSEPEQADDHIDQMTRIMEEPVPEINNTSFPVDVKVGDSWA